MAYRIWEFIIIYFVHFGSKYLYIPRMNGYSIILLK